MQDSFNHTQPVPLTRATVPVSPEDSGVTAVIGRSPSEITDTWTKQQRFLAAYSERGVATFAARAAGIHLSTPYDWRERDVMGFKARWELARQAFTDALEEKAAEYSLSLKPGQNPTMLLGLLNANLPSKWKRNATEDDPAREIMVDLRREIRAAVKETRALKSGGEVSEVSSEVGAVDGEYREIGSEDAEQG